MIDFSDLEETHNEILKMLQQYFIKSIRDFKLNMMMFNNKNQLTLDITKRAGWLNRLRPYSKSTRIITELGGVICGSRALKCYQFNNKPVLTRKPDDWDFIITRDMFETIKAKLCIGKKGYAIEGPDNLSLRRYLFKTSQAYGTREVYHLETHIHLIIKEKLPEYHEVNGIRVADFFHIMEEKISIASQNNWSTKHSSDLENIFKVLNEKIYV